MNITTPFNEGDRVASSDTSGQVGLVKRIVVKYEIEWVSVNDRALPPAHTTYEDETSLVLTTEA
jgi:hypothetical protein